MIKITINKETVEIVLAISLIKLYINNNTSLINTTDGDYLFSVIDNPDNFTLNVIPNYTSNDEHRNFSNGKDIDKTIAKYLHDYVFVDSEQYNDILDFISVFGTTDNLFTLYDYISYMIINYSIEDAVEELYEILVKILKHN